MNKQENSRTLMSVYFGGTDEVFQPLPLKVPAGKVLRCYLEDADSKPVEPKENKLARIFTAKDFPGLPVEPEKSWHEKGELPPVGVECEVYLSWINKWIKVKVVAVDCDRIIWRNGTDGISYIGTHKDNVRPLKTERERFVEAAFGCYEMGMSTENFTKALYDAGFKAPEVAE